MPKQVPMIAYTKAKSAVTHLHMQLKQEFPQSMLYVFSIRLKCFIVVKGNDSMLESSKTSSPPQIPTRTNHIATRTSQKPYRTTPIGIRGSTGNGEMTRNKLPPSE